MPSIALIPGDGIGPEVVEAAVRVVEATGVSVEWDRVTLRSSDGKTIHLTTK